MESLLLKKEIVNKIQNDAILFGKVADALRIKPVTLPRILTANHPRLTQAGVLKILRLHLFLEDEEMLQEKKALA